MHTINMAVDIPICMSMKDVQATAGEDTELQMLKWNIVKGGHIPRMK